MDVLILGVSGMLGHKLAQVLPTHGLDVVGTVRGSVDRIDLSAPFFKRCTVVGGVDVLDGDRLEELVARVRPEWIVNCVGIVKQLPEAQDRYLSVAVNSLLPHRLARVAEQVGARMVHFSTDCVFDGRTGGYRDDAPSDAYDIYGKSKYLGETDESQTAALTLRSSIIGPELFAPRTGLLEWFATQDGGSVTGFTNAIFTGLPTPEMAGLVARLVTSSCSLAGTWNVAAEPINKYELLRLIRDSYGFDVSVHPDGEFRCDRSLSMDRFAAATGYRPPDWPTMISAMADERRLYLPA